MTQIILFDVMHLGFVIEMKYIYMYFANASLLIVTWMNSIEWLLIFTIIMLVVFVFSDNIFLFQTKLLHFSSIVCV